MADIELVIKIPEGLKNDFESEQWTALSCMEMKDALMNGTPLPKGLLAWQPLPEPYKESEERRMSKLEKAKEIVKANYSDADCGIYDCRNLVGDTMTTIYEDEGLTIDICYNWAYFEVFGLSNAEFEELEEYYNSLKR